MEESISFQNEVKDELLIRIQDRLNHIYIDCPYCENMEDDQYTCTHCWNQGGNGMLNINDLIKFQLK